MFVRLNGEEVLIYSAINCTFCVFVFSLVLLKYLLEIYNKFIVINFCKDLASCVK